MDSFTSYEKEWIKLIATFEPVYSEIIKKIKPIFAEARSYDPHFICSAEYFLFFDHIFLHILYLWNYLNFCYTS